MIKIIAAVLAVFIALPAAAAVPTREELKQALEKNPDLVLSALKTLPASGLRALRVAVSAPAAAPLSP